MIVKLDDAQVSQVGLPSHDTVPVFSAPWEATAFAIVLSLYREGRFEWREWVELLVDEIAKAEPDATGVLYYERWTRALERLVQKLGLVTSEAIADRSEAWRRAFLGTPHGHEVLLSNGRDSGEAQ